MAEIVLLIILILVVLAIAVMSLTVMIAYATQTAYDMEKDINDD